MSPSTDAEAYFRALLDSAVDAIIVIDHRGVIETFNRTAEKMFGYTASQIRGQNVSSLMPEPDRSAHDQYLRNYVSTGKAKIIGIGREVTAARKDGSTFPARLSVGEVTQTEPPRFIGIVHDMSEQQRLENEARQMLADLAHASRLSELGEMTAGIAHEINQPLSAISTYANACHRMLAGARTDSEELLNTLHLITDQAQRAGEVVRRLRTFTRKHPIRREALNINSLIDTTLRLMQPDIQTRQFQIRKQLGRRLPPVFADQIQIQQVVLNLIRNAMDAAETAEDRTVTIESVRAVDNMVKVSIVDKGGGIDDLTAEKIFDPFFTTKETGTGVGLSISRSIITIHEGSIGYQANGHGGTTFFFTLPSASE